MVIFAALFLAACKEKSALLPQAQIQSTTFFSLSLNGKVTEGRFGIKVHPGDTLRFQIHHKLPVQYAVYYREGTESWEEYIPPQSTTQKRYPLGEAILNPIIIDSGWKEETLAAISAPMSMTRVDWTDCVEHTPALGCEGIQVFLFKLLLF